MADKDRVETLEAIRQWAADNSVARPSRLTLSRAELSGLAQDRLIDVGCHTATHPRLSSLSPSVQSDEIRSCRSYLEAVLGRPINSFAYPYGGQEDYTADTVSLVREMGFSSACSTLPGLVTEYSDLLQLPRMPVENWDGETFEDMLSEWLNSA